MRILSRPMVVVAINDTITFDDKLLKCVPSVTGECEDCYLQTYGKCFGYECESESRPDKTDVKFVKQ